MNHSLTVSFICLNVLLIQGCQGSRASQHPPVAHPVDNKDETFVLPEPASQSAASFLAFSDTEAMQLSQSTFGRYIGTLRLPAIKHELVAKIDFVTARSSESALELRAVLSLFPGGFSSKEYVSYHFDDVRFDILSGSLIFSQPDQDIFIKSVVFKDGALSADVFSSTSGLVGRLEMIINGSAQPRDPVVPSVGGEYGGTCEGNPTNLQLHTYRTTEDAARVGNPFAAYKIVGSLSDNTYDCDKDSVCVSDVITSGSFNYFLGRLNMLGKRRSYICNVTAAGLDCGTCQFAKVSPKHEVTLTPPTSKNKLLSLTPEKLTPSLIPKSQGQIAGSYSGYLHHEHLDIYQPATIDLTTFQERNGSAQTLQLAAQARLFFGQHGADESLSYKFNPVQFSLLSSLLVFERSGEDVDAVIQVVELGDDVIKGVWHSIQFGRVGTFELKKKPTAPPGDLKLIQPLAGIYKSEAGTLYLDTRRDTSPLGSLNPFFPNIFGGYLDLETGLSTRIQIKGGSYDFYTGRIGIETDSENRTLVGQTTTGGRELLLRKSANHLQRVEQPFSQTLYKLLQ